jgi:hypothetical protein
LTLPGAFNNLLSSDCAELDTTILSYFIYHRNRPRKRGVSRISGALHFGTESATHLVRQKSWTDPQKGQQFSIYGEKFSTYFNP